MLEGSGERGRDRPASCLAQGLEPGRRDDGDRRHLAGDRRGSGFGGLGPRRQPGEDDEPCADDGRADPGEREEAPSGQTREHPFASRAREDRDERHPGGADERERGEHGDLGRELARPGRDQQRREEPDGDRVGAPARLARGRRPRVGDHEEEEDEDLGRGDEDAPELPARDRPEMPRRSHLVTARGEHPDACREREPERHGDHEQPQSGEDREAADHDEGQGEDEPRRERAPPERERICSLGAEQEEAEHEPEVRRVEDVPAAMDDQMLGEERDGGGAREDPPAVQAPPVAVLGAGDAEHERDAVAGQERARRPHEHLPPAERDRDLEHRARP